MQSAVRRGGEFVGPRFSLQSVERPLGASFFADEAPAVIEQADLEVFRLAGLHHQLGRENLDVRDRRAGGRVVYFLGHGRQSWRLLLADGIDVLGRDQIDAALRDSHAADDLLIRRDHFVALGRLEIDLVHRLQLVLVQNFAAVRAWFQDIELAVFSAYINLTVGVYGRRFLDRAELLLPERFAVGDIEGVKTGLGRHGVKRIAFDDR